MSTYVRESLLLTFRSLRAVPRVPERILDVTIQPIVFILLFRYVFGAAISVTHIDYVDYLVPGIIGQGLAFGLIGTGTATSHDMPRGCSTASARCRSSDSRSSPARCSASTASSCSG